MAKGFTGLNSDISLDMESMEHNPTSTTGTAATTPTASADISSMANNELQNTKTCSQIAGVNGEESEGLAVVFRQGMLSAMSDELTRLLLNLDAGNFKKMLDQTRNLVLEQEDEIKRSHQVIQQLEAKVRFI